MSIADANGLALGSVTLLGSGANSFAAATALSRTATLAAVNAPTLTVGGVVVNSGVRNLFTTGAATSVQIQAGAGGTHNLTANGVGLLLELPQPTVLIAVNVTVPSNGTQIEIRSSSTETPGSLEDTTKLAGPVSVKPGNNRIPISNAEPTSTVLVGLKQLLGTKQGLPVAILLREILDDPPSKKALFGG